MKILVTGSAGFIGFYVANALIKEGHDVVGIDNINEYYEPELKLGRLKQAGITEKPEYNKRIRAASAPYIFTKLDLQDKENLTRLFEDFHFEVVIHMAAQAGVRYSLTNPDSYVASNVSGFLNILECCRTFPVKHLVYASTSSVYGNNTLLPFSTSHSTVHPVSFYAATKKTNELMAHTYSHLFNIPTTGLRFFTVYGPWGRPDMALFLFTRSMLNKQPIEVFNNGNMYRDFTYIDDLVDGICKIMHHPPIGNKQWDGNNPDPSSSTAPYKVFNIGNNQPSSLLEFITALENALGVQAEKILKPLQPGDLLSTHADISELSALVNYSPKVSIKEGVQRFVDWYKQYYSVNI